MTQICLVRLRSFGPHNPWPSGCQRILIVSADLNDWLKTRSGRPPVILQGKPFGGSGRAEDHLYKSSKSGTGESGGAGGLKKLRGVGPNVTATEDRIARHEQFGAGLDDVGNGFQIH